MSSIVCSSLSSPRELEAIAPLSSQGAQFVSSCRHTAASILRGGDRRLAILAGPCSIHSREEALEYAEKLKALQRHVEDRYFLIMRVFLEKPRTKLGWKGMLYDPYLDGSNDLQEGLIQGRRLLRDLAEIGVPVATEFLDPLIASYISDLVCWGLIGARTSASQPHRQLASGLPFPVGFKNGVHGELDTAINGMVVARAPHTHFSIDPGGQISSMQTTGNPLAHLVLRGSETKNNSDPESVQRALELLREHHLEERIVIDCAHGNSNRDIRKQRAVFERSVAQASQVPAIRGIMLESNLFEGKQSLPEELDQLQKGISITDPCLGWEETESLLTQLQ